MASSNYLMFCIITLCLCLVTFIAATGNINDIECGANGFQFTVLGKNHHKQSKSEQKDKNNKNSKKNQDDQEFDILVDIAANATIWGYPVVDNYRIQYSYFINETDLEYKTTFNSLFNVDRLYGPEDTAIQTPNADTPYSFFGADLRAEPLVFTVPDIDDRYYSLQFIDWYLYNFDYVGTRVSNSTGLKGGNYLLVGPGEERKKYALTQTTNNTFNAVLHCETEFAFIVYRTQVFNTNDLSNVINVQNQYKVQTLSEFQGKNPIKPSKIDWIKPLTVKEQQTSPDFFKILNFVLQYTPIHPNDIKKVQSFAKIGVSPGKEFIFENLDVNVQRAIVKGMAKGWQMLMDYKTEYIDTGILSSEDGFGTREFLQDQDLARMASTVWGIYGNTKEEAIYPAYFADSNGTIPNANNKQKYEFKFETRDLLPPVNSFWSLTLYRLPESLFYDNIIDRYLINDSMLTNGEVQLADDGSLTIYIQHEEPTGDDAYKKSNWLPAPEGEFSIIMRLYWPKENAFSNGSWQRPKLIKV